jgi:hypothetical protein
MATLEQVRELVRTELGERVDGLVSAVEEDADFGKTAALADAVGELVDVIAGIYGDLEETITHGPGGGQRSGRQAPAAPQQTAPDSTDEDVTKGELLEQARELHVEGRSSMSKEELAKAVEAEESVTKEELLERAREAGVEGRSSMSKDELREALHEPGA